jgi:hypothetical protein
MKCIWRMPVEGGHYRGLKVVKVYPVELLDKIMLQRENIRQHSEEFAYKDFDICLYIPDDIDEYYISLCLEGREWHARSGWHTDCKSYYAVFHPPENAACLQTIAHEVDKRIDSNSFYD